MKLILIILPLLFLLSAATECCTSKVFNFANADAQILDIGQNDQSMDCHCNEPCYHDLIIENQRTIRNVTLNSNQKNFHYYAEQSSLYLDVLLRPPIS